MEVGAALAQNNPLPSEISFQRKEMKHSLSLILNTFFLTIVMVGCGGYARNYPEPTLQEGHIRGRKLLSFETQRAYDKLYLEGITQKLSGNIDAAHELFSKAIELNPYASESLYELGLIQVSLSSKSDSSIVAKGESMLQKALQLEPSNNYFRRSLADRWIQTSKYARATRLYEQMVKQRPNAEDILTLTRLYEIQQDYPNALKCLEQFETIDGEDESTAVEKFKIYLEMGQIAQAYGTIERLSENNPQELRYRVLLADLYMQKGYREKGLAIYDDILTTDPDNKLVKIAMLPYYLEKGDTTRFHKDMTEIMQDPKTENDQKIHLLQAYASEQLRGATGISKGALFQHFLEALSIPQDNADLGNLCLAYADAAKIPSDLTKDAYIYILRDQPDHVMARLMYILELFRMQDYEKIANVSREGIDFNSDVLFFYYYNGLAHTQLDHTIESISIYEEGLKNCDKESEPETVSDMYSCLGDLYHSCNRKEEAFTAYDNALKYNENNLECLNNYAYFLSLEKKELDKAFEMSKRTIDTEPNNPTFLDTFSWILFTKRQYAQALIYINQTIKNLPDEERENASSASLYSHAGDIYFKNGKRQEAFEFWKHALKVSDDKDLTKELTKKIKLKKL